MDEGHHEHLTDGTATIGDALIAWDRTNGAAPAFVWGHGLNSSRASEDQYPLLDFGRLRETHDVIRYDARGHGTSSMLDAPERGSWSALADDQLALVASLGITTPVVLGGASMGVGTALHTAVKSPSSVERLLLVVPPTAWGERAAQVDLYERMATIAETNGPDPLIRAVDTVAPPDPFVGDAVWRQRRIDSLSDADPVRLAANFRGAMHADLPSVDALSAITVPTLILAWTGDTAHPVSTAETLGSTIQGCELVISSTIDELHTWTDRAVEFVTGARSA